MTKLMKTRRFITTGLMSVIAIVGTASMNAQIAEGLIAHWSFDGDLQDPIGDNHGTILNDATYEVDTPTGIGQALLLPGGAENNGVQVPGADLGSNPFTMSYWIKPTTETANAGLERITSRGGDQFETGVGDAGAVGGKLLGAGGGGAVRQPGVPDLDAAARGTGDGALQLGAQ